MLPHALAAQHGRQHQLVAERLGRVGQAVLQGLALGGKVAPVVADDLHVVEGNFNYATDKLGSFNVDSRCLDAGVSCRVETRPFKEIKGSTALRSADALVLHRCGAATLAELGIPRPANQYWVMYSRESDLRDAKICSGTWAGGHKWFNLTSTASRLTSDVWAPPMPGSSPDFLFKNGMPRPAVERRRDVIIAWMARNCDARNNRLEYLYPKFTILVMFKRILLVLWTKFY